jgi:hypothetical protein
MRKTKLLAAFMEILPDTKLLRENGKVRMAKAAYFLNYFLMIWNMSSAKSLASKQMK